METLECESEERDLISLIPEIIALLGGIVSAVLIALPLSSLLNVVPSLGPIIIAPLVEEPTKIIGVILLALYESVAKVKTILQLDYRNVDFIYDYKFFA